MMALCCGGKTAKLIKLQGKGSNTALIPVWSTHSICHHHLIILHTNLTHEVFPNLGTFPIKREEGLIYCMTILNLPRLNKLCLSTQMKSDNRYHSVHQSILKSKLHVMWLDYSLIFILLHFNTVVEQVC